MAPGLEEEVVMQVMGETKDRQYLLDRVEALRSLDFKVDDKKIESALKRYELLQAYNSQDNSRRARRKRVKERFKQICEEQIERLKEEDPSIISGKIKRRGYLDTGDCRNCKAHKSITYDIYIKHIKERGDSYISYIKKRENAFDYCFNCGHFVQD